MSIGLSLSIMFVCLLLEGFFSGAELGVVSADPMQLRHQAAKGSRGARQALEMLENPEWLLSTTLVGTNICVVTNTTVTTALMIHLFGDMGSWIAIGVAAPLIWIFGEIVPKSVFQQKANTITPRVIFILRFFSRVFAPILFIFSTITRVLARGVGGHGHASPFSLREELQAMMTMPVADGDIQPMEKAMIHRLFDFGETRLREVMTPWIDVAAISDTATCAQAARFAFERSHQYLPVYRGRIDRVVGVLNAIDLVGRPPDEPIKAYIGKAVYGPASKSIAELLPELRTTKSGMCVVVDEFGGAEGIVTIEDIVEEVVEEIEDEFDEASEAAWASRIDERHWMVSARIELDDLQEQVGVSLPRGTYATLAGFLLHQVGDIPEMGDVVKYKHLEFTIEQATAQVVKEVRVKW